MVLTSASKRGLAVAATVVILDQVTKWIIVSYVMNPPRLIEVTPFFNLVMGWNRGVSFGMFNNDAAATVWILSIVAIVIIGVLGVWLSRADNRLLAIGLGLIIGGAMGNLIDRLRFGAVADFLDFHAFGYHWPAFNVADTAITIGAFCLLVETLFLHGRRSTDSMGSSK